MPARSHLRARRPGAPLMLRSMKRLLTLTALMATFGTASAATLADNLPAGALLTLQTNGAGPTFNRLLGLVQAAAPEGEFSDLADGLGGLFKGSVGNEATLGMFSVGTVTGGFTPALLAVTRADVASGSFFQTLIPKKPGARVGRYTFVRQGDLFVGMGDGLVYLSSNKTLLMGYLARLGGRAAPRLNTSAAYTVPTRAVGEQELGLYVNFSAAAKVIRGQLGRVLLPRLLSPVVDALDTLGTYAAGFSTTDEGLTASSAQVPNPAGKDRPLYSILTHTTDFSVQSVIPASARTVNANACAPETNGYLGRWLTRIDLLDPTGFLTDSQLAANLETSARYLGDECAQVAFAADGKGSALMNLSATYQRVNDMDAARAHLPGYVASLNEALQGVAASLDSLGSRIDSLGRQEGPATKSRGRAATLDRTQKQLADLKKQLAAVKVVYAFRGDYLVMATSERALAAALDASGPVLADDADFQAAGLNLAGVAGWTYGQAGAPIESSDVLDLYKTSGVLDMPGTRGLLEPFSRVFADAYNRYQGMTSQKTVAGGLILNKSVVRYDWE